MYGAKVFERKTCDDVGSEHTTESRQKVAQVFVMIKGNSSVIFAENV